jgi:hypothetical protein
MSRSSFIVRYAVAVGIAAVAWSALPAQSLRGSMESVDRMHARATTNGLYFYKTATGVRTATTKGRFVPLSGNADYQVGEARFPFALPETRLFLERLASQYRRACGQPLVVTGALRPASDQPANASALSVHPTGMALDLRRPQEPACLTWLRKTLLYLEGAHVIEATEERSPAHFHVAVFGDAYSRYVKTRGARSG